MRILLALAAMVALGTHATAASIQAGLPDFSTLPSAESSLSIATADDLLRVPIAADVAFDERMISTTLSPPVGSGDRTKVPEPAAFGLSGIGVAGIGILSWHRWAIRRVRRPGYIRKRRYERPVTWI